MAAFETRLVARLQSEREVDAAVNAVVNAMYDGGFSALVEDMAHPDPLRYCRALEAVKLLKKRLGKAFTDRPSATGLADAWLIAFDRAFDFDPDTGRCRALERGDVIPWPRYGRVL